MKRTFSITSAALLAAALLSPAFAADSKVYSGAVCKPAVPNAQSGNVDYPLGPPNHYGIRNNNGFTMPIICPIIQDSVSNTSGTSRAYVFWTASSPSDHLVCALKSLNFDGSVREQQFVNGGTGWMQFPNITTDDKFGSYVVDCQLPPHGVLNTIWIEEIDP
jgi:hypothetical protein